jgi:DNA polymerase-3 subunit delta'
MSVMPSILGHERALAMLDRAARTARVHHAYLFEGPRGVGKHTVARWFALRMNCEADPSLAVPCGQCNACRSIAAGNHPDVIELGPDPTKASGQISVDQVREVIRRTGFHRYSGKYRLVILDPAEAMPAAAANALLKTLEEPPEGTGFVLICTSASSLLPTIRSRCQRVRFGTLPEPELARWLERRGLSEPVTLARLSQGSPGEALTLADGHLEARRELRDRLLVTLGGDLAATYAFATELAEGKRQEWMADVEALFRVIEDLLRDVVASASQGPSARLLNTDAVPVVERWRGALWPGGVERCARSVRGAREALAVNVTGRTVLEAVLTRLATELGPARVHRG